MCADGAQMLIEFKRYAGTDRVPLRAGVCGGGWQVGGQQQPHQALALRLPGPPGHGGCRHCNCETLLNQHLTFFLILGIAFHVLLLPPQT